MSKIRVDFSLVNMDGKYEFMCSGIKNLHKIHFRYDDATYHFDLDNLLLIREDKEKKSTFYFSKKRLRYELKVEKLQFEVPLWIKIEKKWKNGYEVSYQLEENDDVKNICISWVEE